MLLFFGSTQNSLLDPSGEKKEGRKREKEERRFCFAYQMGTRLSKGGNYAYAWYNFLTDYCYHVYVVQSALSSRKKNLELYDIAKKGKKIVQKSIFAILF